MAAPAQRMKDMRDRRRARHLRELRLVLPDARSLSVRRRVANQVSKLDPDAEERTMHIVEEVSVFDEDPGEW